MPRCKRRCGIALALVLFVIFIEAVLGFGAISAATLDSQSASQEYLGLRAYDAARAGLVRACAQLQNDYTWATTTSVSYEIEGATYVVSVYPDPDNAASVLKSWRVTSVGACNSATRSLTAWLTNDSFARYAYFTDAERSPGGSTIWFIGADRLTGEVHTNGYFSLITTPRFSAQVTSANRGDADLSGATYTQGGATTTDPSRFYRYYTSYTVDRPVALANSPNFSFAGNQARVPLPTDVSSVRNGASVRLTANAALTFNSDGTVTVVSAGTTTTHSTDPTLTLHTTGSITAVRGTVKGRVTVGADRGITVNGNLAYSDRASDVLGLVSVGDVTIQSSQTSPADFEIDASIMAVGNNPNGTPASFNVANYNSGVRRGTLTVFGGIIQNARGPVGTGTASGVINTGYAKNYVYDDKLLNSPPPNFPTTGKIKVKGCVDAGALR